MAIRLMWLIYDFGLGSNYDGLYTYLDKEGAIECGNGVAFFQRLKSGKTVKVKRFDNIEELKKELSDNIEIGKNDRIYIVYWDYDKKGVTGRFIFGKRKRSPWYGTAFLEKEEEEIEKGKM